MVFTADMIAKFCTGLVIVNNLRQAVVMDRELVATHYIMRGTFIIDVLATGTLWVEVGPQMLLLFMKYCWENFALSTAPLPSACWLQRSSERGLVLAV